MYKDSIKQEESKTRYLRDVPMRIIMLSHSYLNNVLHLEALI